MAGVITDLAAVGLAWARFAPTLAIVPAFGLRALPVPARGILGVALAAGIYPAVLPAANGDAPWVVLAFEQILIGLPIALAAAIPLWAATMAGGLVDSLRGAQDGAGLAVVEGSKATPIAILLSLLASIVFLSTGGPARVASALASASFGDHPLLAAAQSITGGIGIAIALGAPLLAAAVVLEIAFALVARAASPSQVHALLAPLRALGLLAVIALVLDRVVEVLAFTIRSYRY